MNDKYIIRLEESSDYKIVENLTREAFWNVNVPACDEHYLVHILRESKAFIKDLDLVMLINNEIIGNIMYTQAKVIDEQEKTNDVITFGPVSILPKYQKLGYGTILINHSLKLAYQLGYRIVIIYGNPSYYQRFGFVPGKNYDIYSSDGYYNPALQVLELLPGSLADVSGRFIEDETFKLDSHQAELFDANFPAKEKKKCDSQLIFQSLISQCRKR